LVYKVFLVYLIVVHVVSEKTFKDYMEDVLGVESHPDTASMARKQITDAAEETGHPLIKAIADFSEACVTSLEAAGYDSRRDNIEDFWMEGVEITQEELEGYARMFFEGKGYRQDGTRLGDLHIYKREKERLLVRLSYMDRDGLLLCNVKDASMFDWGE